jgi:hypothetical protein
LSSFQALQKKPLSLPILVWMHPLVGRHLPRLGQQSGTSGAQRPFLHDRHFSAASSFQIGVYRGRRMEVQAAKLLCVLSHPDTQSQATSCLLKKLL